MAMAGFSVSKNGRLLSVDDNLYLYYVALTTKAKDRSTTEKKRAGKAELHSAKDVLTFVFSPDPKHSPFSPMATVFCVTEKTVYLIR